MGISVANIQDIAQSERHLFIGTVATDGKLIITNLAQLKNPKDAKVVLEYSKARLDICL